MTFQLQATANVATTRDAEGTTTNDRSMANQSAANAKNAMAPFATIMERQEAAPRLQAPPTKRDDEEQNGGDTEVVSAQGALVAREAPAEKGAKTSAAAEGAKEKASAKDGVSLASNAFASSATELLVERSTPAGEDPGAMKLLMAKDQDGGAKTAVQSIVDDGALASQARSEAAPEIGAKPPTPNVNAAAEAAPAADANAVRVPVPLDATRVPAAAVPTAMPAIPTAALPRAMAAVQQALSQEGVNLKMLGDGARLTMQMQDGTELAVRLLMRDGAVEVRAAGLASTLLEGKAPELRAALSAEGLKLGSFQTRTGHGSGGQAGEHAAFDDDNSHGATHRTDVAPKVKSNAMQARRLQTSNRSVVA